jgi:hypothetical protein
MSTLPARYAVCALQGEEAQAAAMDAVAALLPEGLRYCLLLLKLSE